MSDIQTDSAASASEPNQLRDSLINDASSLDRRVINLYIAHRLTFLFEKILGVQLPFYIISAFVSLGLFFVSVAGLVICREPFRLVIYHLFFVSLIAGLALTVMSYVHQYDLQTLADIIASCDWVRLDSRNV
jgi:hypothetical protein